MAEALVFEAATAIVSEVVKRVMEDFKSPWVTKSDLKKLEIKLVYLLAMLHDAGSRKYEEKRAVVNEWLKRVMDVAYYVEDVLDEYGFEELRKKVEVGSRFKLKGSIIDFHRTNPVAFKIRIAKKAKKAMSLLEAIYKEAHDLGIKPVELTENERILPTSSAFERYKNERDFASYTSGFVGREHDVSKIVELLLSNPSPESSISVVAIVGMGGLGKTTLARRVYDIEAVREHFHKTVWICVSESFSTIRLLNEMVESLTASKCDMSNAEASKRALRKELEGQRYLLVLDDVWNTDRGLWESLLSSLYEISGPLGTMVLVTTRDHEVVETVQPKEVHKLQALSEEESWAFFEQIVFQNEPTIDASDLVAIGKRIVEKCKGIPLAIKMLGGLLRSKKSAQAWKLIERSEIWELPQNSHSILPSLLLSFYYLPSPVKQCFSYCAIFPKDAVMRKNDLIRLWLAQGFLHVPGRNKLAEDIGEEYFNMLLKNSFLLLGRGFRDDDLGMDMDCTMHDLVHDMALFVSKTDCLIWKKENKMDDASNVRHLALLRDNLDADYEFVANGKLGRLRTVHSQISKTSTLLLNARNLRVLKLSGIGLREIPASIRHLKHCRYLDLSNNDDIDSLPDFITELYNLQTLQLQGFGLLYRFPKGMSKLVNLRHLPTSSFVEMPAGMKYLTHLQTLPWLSLQESGGCTIDEIGYLHDVRGDLRIKGLEFVASKDAAVKARMGKKTAIVSLELRWANKAGTRASSSIERVKDGSTDKDVLDGLRPHPNLKQLEVFGYKGKRFALWLERMTVVDEMGNEASLNSLVQLCLSKCKNCEKLPTLGQLPCLRDLEISDMESVNLIGIEFYVYSEDSSVDGGGNVGKCGGRDMLFFPALKELRLIELPALTEWVPPPKGERALPFPCLKNLEVRNCPHLISTPTQFPCLNSLSMERIGSSQPLEIITHNSRNLRFVELNKFPHVTCLPEELRDCRNLEYLFLDDLSSLISLPSLDELKSLHRLTIGGCKGLLGIHSGLDCCTSLTNLSISGCDNIETVPNLQQLTNLEFLRVFKCKKLTSLPEDLECLHRLRGLSIGGFQEELEYFPDVSKLADLKSLTSLYLYAWPELKSLPDKVGLLTTLQGLIIINFYGMEVPEWIGNLSSLVELRVDGWPNLKHLPSRTTMLRLKRLRSIYICGCPHMIERCAKHGGPERHKISHVPEVFIDGKQLTNYFLTDGSRKSDSCFS